MAFLLADACLHPPSWLMVVTVKMFRCPRWSWYLCMVLVAGCATAPPRTALEEAPSIPRLLPETRTFWNQLLEADIVYLPEVHDNDQHHRTQLAVINGLDDRMVPVLLGMEMFTLDQQPLLDRWRRGRLSLDALLTEVNWAASWGGYSALYRTILESTDARSIPVYALNAPRTVVRAVAGGQPVARSDRRWLPGAFDTPPGGLHFFSGQMRNHPRMTPDQLESYYAVQALWEQTMAETILQLHRRNPGKTIVVMLGRGHADPRFGVPFYVAQKTNARQVIVDPTHE